MFGALLAGLSSLGGMIGTALSSMGGGIAKTGTWLLNNSGKILTIASGVQGLMANNRQDQIRRIAMQQQYNEAAEQPSDNMEIMTALSELKNNAKEKADKIEDTLIDILESRFYPIIELLERDGISSRNIERAINASSSQIRKILKNEIASQISIGNERCLRILKMQGVEGRTESMGHFYNEVLTEALEKIKDEVANGFEMAQLAIEDTLQDKIAMQKALVLSNKGMLQDMIQNSDIETREKSQLRILKSMTHSSILCNTISQFEVA